jgi:transcriptional regulator with XRE-family HTH domain
VASRARRDLARAFGEALRSSRLRAGISQEELAHRAELSRNFVGLLEQGRRTPALAAIFALAGALSESPANLISAVEGLVAPSLTPRPVAAADRKPGGRYLPVYSVEAAAGQFLDNEPVEAVGWVEAPQDLSRFEDLFVAHVRGRSMEPLIPDGSAAVFRAGVAGDREGRILLVQLLRAEDPEGGGAFTVKRWHSEKEPAPEDDGGWRHSRIELRPLNRAHPRIELSSEQDLRVIAEFVERLWPG